GVAALLEADQASSKHAESVSGVGARMRFPPGGSGGASLPMQGRARSARRRHLPGFLCYKGGWLRNLGGETASVPNGWVRARDFPESAGGNRLSCRGWQPRRWLDEAVRGR